MGRRGKDKALLPAWKKGSVLGLLLGRPPPGGWSIVACVEVPLILATRVR